LIRTIPQLSKLIHPDSATSASSAPASAPAAASAPASSAAPSPATSAAPSSASTASTASSASSAAGAAPAADATATADPNVVELLVVDGGGGGDSSGSGGAGFGGYALVGADLRDLKQLSQTLRERAGVDFSLPTLLISECVLVYLQPQESQAVIEWAAREFVGGAVMVTYEQILPFDAFGQTMVKNLQACVAAVPAPPPLFSVSMYSFCAACLWW
jgi:hypothetical protein